MAKRNPNGEGTIYRRKDGRYEGAGYVLIRTARTSADGSTAIQRPGHSCDRHDREPRYLSPVLA